MHSSSNRDDRSRHILKLAAVTLLALLGVVPVGAVNQLSDPPVGQLAKTADGAQEPSTLGRYLAGRAARRDGDSASAADFLAFALAGDPGNEQLQAEAFAVGG